MNRRSFVKATALAASASLLPQLNAANKSKGEPNSLPFKLDLNPGIIGVDAATQETLLDMAVRHGFESITPFSGELASMSENRLVDFTAARKAANIGWGSTNLPVEFRRDELTFRSGLAKLPRHAKALQRAGANRMNTWIMPTHPELHYSANMKQHAQRLRQCGEILADHEILLGLEYVGAKTLQVQERFAFIRTLVELQDLLAEINLPNVGYVLDSFHWYCAEDSVDQIRSLNPKLIASVDLNDARSDLSRDTQIDGTRELPLATGVIDLESFLKALVAIHYTGPIRAEPFNETLREMDNEQALNATYQAMSAAFDLVR